MRSVATVRGLVHVGATCPVGGRSVRSNAKSVRLGTGAMRGSWRPTNRDVGQKTHRLDVGTRGRQQACRRSLNARRSAVRREQHAAIVGDLANAARLTRRRISNDQDDRGQQGESAPRRPSRHLLATRHHHAVAQRCKGRTQGYRPCGCPGTRLPGRADVDIAVYVMRVVLVTDEVGPVVGVRDGSVVMIAALGMRLTMIMPVVAGLGVVMVVMGSGVRLTVLYGDMQDRP